MPLYEYKCNECNDTFEVLQRISAEPVTTCKRCGGTCEKLISTSSFQFKGNGWYVTDYKKRSAAKTEGTTKTVSNDEGTNKDATIK